MPKCVYVEPSGEISQAHLNDDRGYIRLPFGERYMTSAASGGAAVVPMMPTDMFGTQPPLGRWHSPLLSHRMWPVRYLIAERFSLALDVQKMHMVQQECCHLLA